MKNKTAKKIPTPSPTAYPPTVPLPILSGTVDSVTDFVSDAQMYQESKGDSTAPIAASSTEARQQRINELVQQMHQRQVDNDGQRLADFKPLTHPIVRTKKPEDTLSADVPVYLPNPIFGENSGNPVMKPPSAPSFVSANANQDQDGVQNYYSVYRPPTAITQAPYYGKTSQSSYTSPDVPMGAQQKWSDKMNYIIHLLEEQNNEKTNTSMEEFVMFTMVGVFIIYVLDSFSRHGRYVR